MVFQVPRVAVIGSGLSGIVSAKHLRSSGVEVVVYERYSKAGGNWVFDERKAPEPKYPSAPPSQADFVREDTEKLSLNGKSDSSNGHLKEASGEIETALAYAPPGPAYDGLTTNVPTDLQEFKGYPWPEGNDQFVNVRVCGEYLQSFSRKFGVEEVTRFNSRVENVEKKNGKWIVQSTTLITEGPDRGHITSNVEEFDRVVVANGHYHASKVPDTPGLKEWKAAWPDRVQHSKSYRKRDEFKDQNVLLIGAGVSSFDIAREIAHTAKNVYQSSRGGPYDIPVELLHPSTQRVAEVVSYELPSEGQARPGRVTLKDGKILTDIDRVVICTGYHFSLPFLQNFHDDSLPVEDANDTILVTDGTQLHNLHKDIFYIPDPTLAFIGVPFYTATFSFFEYQAIVLAAVFSGRAWLPSEAEMRKEYEERVQRKGFGRGFHDLKNEETKYVKEVVEWINAHAEITGAPKVEGHSEEWVKGKAGLREKFLKFLAEKEKKEREKQLLVVAEKDEPIGV